MLDGGKCTKSNPTAKSGKENPYRLFQLSGKLFRIEPEMPYPVEYKPCTEVAKAEKESNARPVIKNKVENWDEYDTVLSAVPYGGGRLR